MTRRVAIPAREKKACWLDVIGHKFSAPCQTKCGAMIDVFNYEAGHVISAAKGGVNMAHNLRPICATCNKEMGAEDMREYIKRKKYPTPSWMQVKFALKPGHIILAYERGKAPAANCYVELTNKIGVLVDVSQYPIPVTSVALEDSAFIAYVKDLQIASGPLSEIYGVTEPLAPTWEFVLSGDLERMILSAITAMSVYGVDLPTGRYTELIELCCRLMKAKLSVNKSYHLATDYEPITAEVANKIASTTGTLQNVAMQFTDKDLTALFMARHRLGLP